MYDTKSSPNPKFSGKTIIDYMKEKDDYFKNEYEISYCFDGDTLEFMTQKFYKTTTDHVVAELLYIKKTFLKKLNLLKLFSPLIFPKENYGFARYATNENNLAIFNNGTYHFNFTLPTQLDRYGNIQNRKDFIMRHKKAIHIIQCFEPFFIAKFGTADKLSECSSKRYPKGSQRCAASRYISVGTYDTKKMITGKLLQEDRKVFENKWPTYNWYTKLYEKIDYVKNDKIGFDINFNKFKNHGIELRFFDWFPEEKLLGVLNFLVHILDHCESKKHFESVTETEEWNNITFKAIYEGKEGVLSKEEYLWLKKYLQLKIKLTDYSISYIYDKLEEHFTKLYGTHGPCSSYMLEQSYCC